MHPSQRIAARALGLGYAQTLRLVVLPQALRKMTPPLMNDFVAMQKDVGLVSIIGARRCRARRADRDIAVVQLHAVHRGGAAVRAARDPDDPPHRLVHGATAASRADGVGRMSALLQAIDLRKSFGDRPVLRGVSVEIAAHEVVAVIGASGSGKSTLLRCLNLLETIDDGQILLGGEDISDPRVDANRVRARFGAVFQSYNLFPHLSVLDNVTLAAALRAQGVARGGGGARSRAAGAGRPRRQGARAPRPSLRRAAAARGDRAGDRDRPRDPAARRDHLGARSRAGRRGARARPRARRRGQRRS